MDQENVGSKRSSSSASSKIASRSQEAADQVKEAVVGQVTRARDGALHAQEHASDRIRRVANQLRAMGGSLREDDPLLAGFAERVGDGVDSVAGYVSDVTPRRIIQDTERIARRQPALFYGAALLVGLAAGRFIKSSRPEGGSLGYADDEPQGERQARERRERDSGFFPSAEPGAGAERSTRSNQRYQANYDAAFARDDEQPRVPGADRPASPPRRAPEAKTGDEKDGGVSRPAKGNMS
jgi:hypothetical protein